MAKDSSYVNPPKWANRFLEWYCANDLLDEIQGDLLEAFYYRKEEEGLRKAKWWFIWDVLRFFRPSSFKTKSNNSNQLFMLKNNIKIALRIIARKKWASFVNIISLTLGITAVTLISFFVSDEFSYDNFHKKKENIYRLITDMYLPDGQLNYTAASHPLPLAAEFKSDFSEIKNVTRVSSKERYLRNNDYTHQEDVLFADQDFFQAFSFPFLMGNEETALEFSKNIVITEDLARRYFQSIDVVGKTLEIRQDEVFTKYQVTGVVETIPSNSTFKFDLVMNFDQVDYYSWAGTSWNFRADEIYMLLNENTDIAAFNAKIKDHWKKYLKSELKESKDYKGDYMHYKVQLMEDVHMSSDVSSSYSTGDPMNSYILSGIAIIILLIGCANFTILSIGRSALRGKEVAIKKVVGAKKKQLIIQFWTEAMTLSVFAMLLSIGLVILLIPAFNLLSEKSFRTGDVLNEKLLVILPVVAIVAGLIAGIYPSLVMSGIRILDFFKKKVSLGRANLFTKSLITVQFSLSVMLLLGAIVVFQQINFFRTKNLGYSHENIIVLENTLKTEPKKVDVFKNLLASNPNIAGVAGINSSFGRGGFSSSYDKPDGTELNYNLYFVEPDLFEILGIDLKAGRNFNKELSLDSNSVIVNEKFAREIDDDFEVEDRAVGLRNAGLANPKIIGVTNDFHFNSLARELKPVVMLVSVSKDAFDNLLIKTTESPGSELIKFIETSWLSVAPDSPFNFTFMGDDIESQYQAEQRWFAIVKYSTLWALGLATLGLLGIVSLSISGRLKEVSIRKVLGAGTTHLYFIIARQFTVLLVIASLIAIPITVYFAEDWLNDYAYHITINPLMIGAVLLIVFAFIISIVFAGTSRALRSNPVNSLRME